ncbi:MAG: hypothetical protein GOVbin962_12 [Prokaryotic dsDNA virus sp.]|nr:MAG: hypothetical protein GOVbin962_12 [Prokaryotic dsDNA virus sp.]
MLGGFGGRGLFLAQLKLNKMITETLKQFLKDDLVKLDYHTNELIDNLIVRGNDKEFKNDIEQIQQILNYWHQHLKNIK